MPKSHKIVAIRRDAFFRNPRFVYALPTALSDYVNGDAPRYEPLGMPSISLPIEYFLIPVTSAADWDGVAILRKWLAPLAAKFSDHIHRQFSTLDLPELRHSETGDHISILQMGFSAYEKIKPLATDSLIEVDTLEELVKTHRLLRPEEPPIMQLPNAVREVLARVPDGPLHGILVVAYDQQIAGSLASEELARAGATVIKIEKRDGGDPKRSNSSPTAFNTFNAGKSSVVFDNTDEDQQLKEQILATADVIIDNRSEGAKKRDHVLQESLQRKDRQKPLIYCSISGFGRGTEIPAYDRVVQAAAGMADLNGRLISFPLIDMATGKEAAKEISNYLFYRERMYPRQFQQTPCIRLDISMAAVALNMMANPIATYLDTGKLETTIVPFDLYDTNDGKIAIGVATDWQFEKLCIAIQAPDLSQFATNKDRQIHKDAIEYRLHEILKTKSSAEWMTIFGINEISASPVKSLPQALEKYGHDVIKPTMNGGLFITGPTASNIHPRTPIIGPAPAYGADKSTVMALMEHLKAHEKDPQALDHSLEAASEHPHKSFQREYKFVDIHELDFSRAESNISWAQGKFFYIRKIGMIEAAPAKPGEVVAVTHNSMFMSHAVALAGDWKITTRLGDLYLRKEKKLKKNYVSVAGSLGKFIPNPELPARKAIQVTEDICFLDPAGDTTYIPAGGWIVLGSDGPYGIHPNNIPDFKAEGPALPSPTIDKIKPDGPAAV